MTRERGSEDAARRELLAIQKRLWRRLKREIEASITDNPPNVEIYQEEYERDLRRYEAVSSKRELVEAAAAADLVYVGDYHTLPQAQKTLVKLLLALSKVRRQVVLAMEMVHAAHQPHLDAFCADAIDEGEFLRRIDYERSWGFPWQPYGEIFAVAKRRGVRVVGINSDPLEHTHDHLLERDFRTAQVIADEVAAQPEALVVVFDGDLHVARDHLPFLVGRALDERHLGERRQLIVHQNAEEIYWQLARERREQVNVVRLAPDAYCVLNASPIEKLHSYLNWVSERPALDPPLATSHWEVPDGLDELFGEEEDDDESDDRGAEYAEQVHAMVVTVARFLGIERDDLDAFTLFTVNDLDFFDYLLTGRGDFTEVELEDIKRQILSNESYFIPKGDIIYLSDFSVVNAAEEGTHFLHHLCSGYRWDKPRGLETDFYFRVVTEALGFFGSKVIVPTRECWRERDCEIYLERHRTRERERRRRRRAEQAGQPFRPDETGVLAAVPEERVKLLLSQRLTLEASRLVLHHKQLERDYLEHGEWTSAGRALTQPAELHLLITHMLGHMLGDKLYWGLVAGALDKKRLRDLFHEPLERKHVARDRYLDLVRLTAKLSHGPSRGELL